MVVIRRYIPLLFLLSFLRGYCQELPSGFVRISGEEGLVSDNISRIYRDSYGFIWLASPDGLMRFDGQEYKLYIPMENDSTSISDPDVRCLYEDSQRRIWVGNFRGGANRYDPRTENFRRFKPGRGSQFLSDGYITSITEDRTGRIWLGTFRSGIDVYFPEKDSIFHLHGSLARQLGLLSDSIRSLYTGDDGSIWVGTYQDGIYRIQFDDPPLQLHDLAMNLRINRYSIEVSGKICPSRITNITADRNHDLLITTNGQGIFRLIPSNGIISEWQALKEFPDIASTSKIRKIIPACFSSGYWVATLEEGIIYVDPANRFFRHYLNDPVDPLSLSGNKISDILCLDNDLWITTVSSGLSRMVPSGLGFRTFRHNPFSVNSLSEDQITSVTEDRSGNILAGTEAGDLNVLDPKTGRVTRINSKQFSGEPNNRFQCLLVDRQGDLWAGGYGNGLFKIRFKNGWIPISMEHFKNDPQDSNSLSNDYITGILETRNGEIWITTVNGIDCYKGSGSHFRIFRYSPDNPEGLNSRAFMTLFEDSGENLWFGSMSRGISILRAKERNAAHPRFEKMEHHPNESNSLRDNVVTNIIESRNGFIWISTARGLDRYDPNTGKFTHFTSAQGLPSETVYSTLEDLRGQLWISTGNGLSRLNLKSDLIRNFSLKDGLPGADFNQSAFCKARSGYFYYGGTSGLCCFNPDLIRPDSTPPLIALTEFKLFDQTVKPGEKVLGKIILSESITTTQEIVLDYRQNIIGFEWAVLDFAGTHRNESAIMLEGYEDQWRNLGNISHTTYTNLNPGHYVLHIKAANADGFWNAEGIHLRITILPPFWQTWWFRVISIFTFLLLIYSAHRFRVYYLTQQRKELEYQVQERTLTLEKVNRELIEQNNKIDFQAEELRKINDELLIYKDQLEDIIRDRTSELITAKNKAEESDRLKTSFLANMSHEIRTPMNAIVGFSGMLADPEVSSNERNEYIQIIQANSNYLLRLINDIIDLSMLHSGQLKLHWHQTDIHSLLTELFVSYHGIKTKGEKQNIRLVLALANRKETIENPENIPLLQPLYFNTDPVRLRQLMINLLDNAFKYTESGSVTFGYKWDNINGSLQIVLYVKDTGVGIPESLQHKIFDRFYKIETPQVQTSRGTGLGLSISKTLTEQLGGEIRVQSEEGKGSLFTLSFPFTEIPSVPDYETKTESEEQSRINLEGKTILIAEDEESNFELLKGYLKHSGVKILHAQNGMEAIDLFGLFFPEFTLMDLKMETMDGIQAMQEIRKIKPDALIIAQTAQVFASDVEDLRKKGFDAVLLKPIRREDLFLAIARCEGAGRSME